MTAMSYDYTVFAGKDVKAERIKLVTQLIAQNKDLLSGSQPLFRGLDPAAHVHRHRVPLRRR